MAAGVVLGGAAMSVAAAKVYPGRSSKPATATGGSLAPSTTVPASGTTVATPDGGSATPSTSPALTAPVTTPQPVYTPPVVNSGGS